MFALEAPTRAYHGHDPLGFVLSLNLHRRHMSATQLAFLALKIEEVEAKAAEARQKELAGTRPNKDLVQKIAQGNENTGRARDKAAKAVGANHSYVSDAKRLAKIAPDVVTSENNAVTISVVTYDIFPVTTALIFSKSSSTNSNQSPSTNLSENVS